LSTVINAAGAFMLVLVVSGCVERGILFSHTVEPYSEEFQTTPVGTKSCVVNSHEIQDPLTGYNASAAWTTSAIQKAARHAGISEIHYIDKKSLSFLNGLYRRESLVIYGD